MKAMSILFIIIALSACAVTTVRAPTVRGESPCAPPNPQPDIKCDGYGINP